MAGLSLLVLLAVIADGEEVGVGGDHQLARLEELEF